MQLFTKHWVSWLMGIVLTYVLFAMPVEHCAYSYGYGFPFSWHRPGIGESSDYEWGTIVLTPENKFSDVIDLPNLAISLAIWSFAIGFLIWHKRRKGVAPSLD